MPLNQLQADDITRYICGLRPDFPKGAVHAMLTSDKTTGYSAAQIIAAAFHLVQDRRAKTIQLLPDRLDELFGKWATHVAPRPLAQPAPGYAHQMPAEHRYLHPVRVNESCPVHEGGLKHNCAGCRADALALVDDDPEEHPETGIIAPQAA